MSARTLGPPGGAGDFLGLGLELDRRAQGRPPAARTPATPPAQAPAQAPFHDPGTPAMPPAELLPPGAALQARWPEARPPNSWLLQLRDGEVPPARTSPGPTIARPAPASFCDVDAAPRGLAPWQVRGLLAALGLVLCAAIAKTLVSSRAATAPEDVAPDAVQTTGDAPPRGLAPPDADAPARARPRKPGSRPARDANGARAVETGGAASSARGVSETPAVAVYPIPAKPPARELARRDPDAPPARPGTWSAEAQERLDRLVLEPSRASTPLADVAAVTESPAASAQGIAPATTVGTWEGATVPIEALDGALRFLTPAVGRVRARLHAGPPREGRLIAIGQGRIWIESEGSEVVIESAGMSALEQLAMPAAEPRPAADRVRVRTNGGVFFGQVLGREGRNVTIETDEGARLTLESDDVRACAPDAPPAGR